MRFYDINPFQPRKKHNIFSNNKDINVVVKSNFFMKDCNLMLNSVVDFIGEAQGLGIFVSSNFILKAAHVAKHIQVFGYERRRKGDADEWRGGGRRADPWRRGLTAPKGWRA